MSTASLNTPGRQRADIVAMQQALDEARRASARAEVPVGAVVVHAGRVIGRGHNAPAASSDPTAHAEIIALRAAAQARGNYRLQDCTLFVTLEPCAMCAGAILNARVGRVVFGASDPKSGAAGSVINLFANGQLNHQTQVQGGVLADACSTLLRSFFQARRQQPARVPLREDALRTPDAAFHDLAHFPWQPQYIHTLPALDGLRLHYIDEGPAHAPHTWLLLHGVPAWSHAYRHVMQALVAAGQHVLAPDLPGFGKSDKPKKERAHQFMWHARVLVQWLQSLPLRRITPVGFGLGAGLAQALALLRPDLCNGVLLLTMPPATAADRPCRSMAQFLKRHAAGWTAAERQACAAPFPDRGFEAALRVADWDVSASLSALRRSAPPPSGEPVRIDIAGDVDGAGVSILPAADRNGCYRLGFPSTPSATQVVPDCLRSAPAAQALAAAILAHSSRHLRLS